MHNKAHQVTTLYNERIFSIPEKLANPANENSVELNIFSENSLDNSKITLLSKRLEFILLKLKLNSEELVSLLQN